MRTVMRAVIAAAIVVFVLRAVPVVPGLPSGEPVRSFFDAAPAAWALALALAVALFRYGAGAARELRRAPRWALDLGLFAVTAILVRWVTRGAFGDRPIIGDEISYDLLARRFAFGEAVPLSGPLSEMERIRFSVDDGRNYPLFQPGWPALLALFWRAHAPALGPAFATGMFVVATFRLAERLFGRLASLFAAAALLMSAFVSIIGASLFAHAWAAGLFVLALEGIVVALERRSTWAAALAGVAAAWLFVTRMPSAFALAIVAVPVLVTYRTHRRARHFAVFVLLAALGPLAQMGWNHATTGDVLELPQDRYFALTEPIPDCHRLGFGTDIGCRREHHDQITRDGFTPARALEVTRARWSVLRTNAWGTPLPFVVAALFLLRRWDRRTVLVIGATIAPIAVYFAFYYHAVMFGARLYYELMAPLAIAIGAFLAAPFEDAEGIRGRAGSLSRLVSAFALATLVVVGWDELTDDLPTRFDSTGRGSMQQGLSRHLDARGVHHAIVYVEGCHWPDVADAELATIIPLHTEPPESRDRWFVRDFGALHDRQLAGEHPGFRSVRLRCGWALEDVLPAKTRELVTELEAKFPPDEQHAAYTSLVARPDAGNKALWRVVFQEPAALVRFRQWVPVDGTYAVLTTFVRAPTGGRFALSIDGVRVEPPLDARGPDALVRIPASVTRHLARGTHVLELSSLEPQRAFQVDLDRLELHPR